MIYVLFLEEALRADIESTVILIPALVGVVAQLLIRKTNTGRKTKKHKLAYLILFTLIPSLVLHLMTNGKSENLLLTVTK
jgi:hypothetical protein